MIYSDNCGKWRLPCGLEALTCHDELARVA